MFGFSQDSDVILTMSTTTASGESNEGQQGGWQLMRLPRSFGRRFAKKRSGSATISDLDPTFRVTYLGNVLTAWAKGKSMINNDDFIGSAFCAKEFLDSRESPL